MKKKGIVICIISLLILTMVVVNLVTTKVYATDLYNDVLNGNNTAREDIRDEGNNAEDEDGNTNKNENLNKNSNVNNNVNNKNANANNNSGIPYTGVDNSVIFVIIAFGISAVFAYKKIRDYKNI